MNALSILSSLLGMLLGTAGLTVSILNYLRDRSKVRVTLQWNMVDTHTKQVHGLVRVTNVGRRVVYVGIAALEIPGGTAYILGDSIPGRRLAEGDEPAAFLVNHDGMAKHAGDWRRIRAFVEISTGEKFYSDYPRKNDKPPKWANQNT